MTSKVLASGFLPDEAFMSKLNQIINDYKERNSGQNKPNPPTGQRLDQSSPGIVTAVNDCLIPSIGILSQLQRAANITVLWMQHVAKGIAKVKHGWSDDDCSNPDKLNSTEWLTIVQSAIVNNTAWVQPTEPQFQNYTASVSGGESIASFVARAVSMAAGPPAGQVITDFGSRMTEGDAAGVNDVGQFFWNQKAIQNQKSFFGYFPYIANENIEVEFSYASVFLNPTPDSWYSLFGDSGADRQVSVWATKLILQYDLFQNIEEDVEEQLGEWIGTSIISVPMPGS
ncbi:hypothetical protein ACFW16_18700 [Inquilinus sp. NPDC058860]|uniref:hypothetical protein n=1 Tax=Inquilinus sp. NPDC058860 TaxID=3346652 RepID=UPI0036A0F927